MNNIHLTDEVKRRIEQLRKKHFSSYSPYMFLMYLLGLGLRRAENAQFLLGIPHDTSRNRLKAYLRTKRVKIKSSKKTKGGPV